MKTVSIVAGIVFIIVAILVIFADNVNVFGFTATANVVLRNIITVILVLLGLVLIVIGIGKKKH